jgi:multidrug efflux pump
VAKVYLSSKASDKKSFVVVNLDKQTTTNALSFQISKVPGFDIQKLTADLKAEIQKFSAKNSEFTFVETTSQEDSINRIYNLFMENFLETGLLVFVIILFFLGFRSSFIILFSFVIVYLVNFIFLKSIDYSFNNIVSFSLILVLGIMVDNLIVIAQ